MVSALPSPGRYVTINSHKQSTSQQLESAKVFSGKNFIQIALKNYITKLYYKEKIPKTSKAKDKDNKR